MIFLHNLDDEDAFNLADTIMDFYDYDASPEDMVRYCKDHDIFPSESYDYGDFYNDYFLIQGE